MQTTWRCIAKLQDYTSSLKGSEFLILSSGRFDPEKEPAYRWDRRLIWLYDRPGNFEQENSLLLTPRFEPRDFGSVFQVAIDKYFYVPNKRVWSRGCSLHHASADRSCTTWPQNYTCFQLLRQQNIVLAIFYSRGSESATQLLRFGFWNDEAFV